MYDNSIMYLYKSSKAWIEDTISRYSTSLYNTKEKLRNDVMVYGRSQVGKTTFILKLIGIKQDKYSELEHILRGGRPKGESATSVATLYTCSDSQYFFLEEKNINTGVFCIYENLTEEEMCKKIAEIRDNLRRWETDKIIKIGIPLHFFDKEIVMNTQIIDFPGIASDSEEEYRYIKDALSFYQLRVSAIILFELKSKIKFFKRPLEAGLRFDLNPNKYILVTTMSFSSSEMKRRFKEEKWTMEDIINKNRDDLLKELRKNQSYQFVNIPEYFPVEIGESLSNLVEKESEYGDLLEKCMEGTFDSVRKLIELKNNNTLFSTIEEIRSGKIRGYEDEIQKMNDEKKEKRNQISKIQRKIFRAGRVRMNYELKLKNIEEDIELFNEKKHDISEIKIDNKLIELALSLFKEIDLENKQRDDIYSSFVSICLEMKERSLELLKSFMNDISQNNLESKIFSKLAEANNRLKKDISKGWETKKNCRDFTIMVKEELEKVFGEIENIMKSYINEYMIFYKSELSNLGQQKDSISSKKNNTEERICKLNQKKAEIVGEISNLDLDISNVERHMSNQQEILDEILETANLICDEHKNQYKTFLSNTKIDVEQKFMSYLVYKKICEDQERMNWYYGKGNCNKNDGL